MQKKQADAKKNSRKPAAKPRPSRIKAETGLNFEQQAFVDELLSMERRVAWKAYQRVYRCANKAACEAAASRLLSLAKVQKAIAAGEEARLQRVEYTQDQMFNRLYTMLTADVSEIVEHRRENCRHCHGIDHKYQWKDEAEHERVCREITANAQGEKVELPPIDGGFGFDPHAMPNADCPNCGGEGYGRTHIHDTRFLSPGARMLYAGVKETQNGIEVKLNDQLAVARLMMQHMGMLDPKLTLKGDNQNPLVALLQSLPGNTLKPVEDD